MRAILSTFLVSLALLADLTGASDAHRNSLRKKRHSSPVVVERALIEQNVTTRALEKRFDDARFTFFSAGLGACGKTNSGGDFIVALNSAQYAGGAHCFETITISVNGKTHSAEIVDECPGCPFGGLDFSVGLFTFFAPESVGVLTGSWNFGGSAAPPPPPPPKHTPPPPPPPPPPPKPKPTTHTPPPPPPPPPPPKTTEHSTTSTHTTHITTHTSSSTSIKSTPSPTPTPTSSSVQSSTSSTVVPLTTTAAAPQVNNIEQFYVALVQMGGVIMAAPAQPSST